jgi:hypothetical protein
MVAQLAGVVSFDKAHAEAGVAAAAVPAGHIPADHAAHHHAHIVQHDHGRKGIGDPIDHGLAGDGVAGHCCALHAFIIGIVPVVLTAPNTDFCSSERLEMRGNDFTGLSAHRLDRPPRSLL